MTRNIQCQETSPHSWHSHEIIATRLCVGRTPCGENLHSAHPYVVREEVWCNGICDCGDNYRGSHGPGAHK